MYTISKKFNFSASHELKQLPEGHPCRNCHGHNYIAELVLQSEKLNKYAFVRDYGELSILKKYINDNLDHRHLNDIFDFEITAENIAKHLFDFCKKHWPETAAVRVSETLNTWAVYSEGNYQV
ncbi:MAG: 6-pyruvoyl tetrahydropterin synthase family protein [Desulfobacula sp.]|jgi:6-pyruvoyltetrahydropterin/6-carboxytetrahydropterin synthase|nr:6-pyruvoyl tetrahydropterin synthase family protein [Desulfobacula sp.]